MFLLKLKDFVQKSFFRLIMLSALVLFLGVFIFASQMDKYSIPPENMQVPFGDASGKAIVGGASSEAASLATQNFSSAEISMYLTETIADALSFNQDNYATNTAAMQMYFTPEGYKAYTDFLTTAGFLSTLQGQNLQSSAYAEQPPVELTHGVYNGVYKWVYEVPVTVSFIPRNAEGYDNNAIKAQNRRFLLRVQFARVWDDPPVKIELWQALPPRSAK